MKKVQVGIDLGTTNTLAYCRVKGKMKPLKFNSKNMLPSVMYVEKQNDGSIKEIVGQAAKIKGINDPDNYISSSKTYIGLTGENKRIWNCHGKVYTPTDVAAKILEEVNKKVRDLYGLEKEDVVQAVITIPAYFTSTQSDETKRAGERAGMEVVRIITEPVAAAFAAAENDDIKGKIFVVDLGGGTFDVSILNVGEKYKTLKIGGERRLGGDDFDEILSNYFIKHIEEDLSIDLSSQETSGLDYSNYYTMMAKIKVAATDMKEQLSSYEEYEINIANLFQYGDNKQYDFSMTLSRNEFNDMCETLFDKIIGVIENTAEDCENFELPDLKKIFLVGGSCYIPKIQEDVEEYFGMSTDSQQDRATLVAMGAGKIADAWDGLTNEENRVDPFENMLQDIISHDMGIEILGDKNQNEFSCILEKGHDYPCKLKKKYYTAFDNQDSVVIKVYEKTKKDASNNFEKNPNVFDLYGSFELIGIPPAPKGETPIEVTFDYDESRTLNVTAEDTKNHISQTVELHKGEEFGHSERVMPMDFYLLIDVSGSMYGNKIEQAKKACVNLIQNTLDLNTHKLGIITFGWNAELLCELTNDKQKLMGAIDRIKIDGNTNMSSAILLANEKLASSGNKAIIIITDVVPNNKQNTQKAAYQAAEEKIKIATIGVEGADFNYLCTLTNDDDLNFRVDDIAKLSDIFGEAVQNLLRS